ncbi:MAG: metallophosphoesterase [Oscillospiraceae bacterium]|nr:metallophosphoesterase [Oscillospiraceae bacterium]
MRRLISTLLALCLALSIGGTAAVAEKAASGRENSLRIAVGSDLHLDPDNTDKSLGSEVVYSLELVDALLLDAKAQGAEMILLTGDLVNGGKPHRHEALADKLRRAEAEGLPVYVLPGNHDLSPITQTQFAEYYAEFGYDEAYSRDQSSLSYCIVRDGLMLLMMDTAGYSAGAIDLPEAPARSDNEPFFTEATLRWAEALMQEAQREGWTLIAAGHYNLLPEISKQPGSGYCIENGDRFTELLKTYGAPLYLSGHMHVRGVYQEDSLTELLTEFLLGYPTAYSMLDLGQNTLQYAPRRIDVDAWAARTGQSDPVLLHFADWQQEGLYHYAVNNVAYMSERNPLTEEEKGDAVGFFYTVMNAFWSGTLYEQRKAVEAMPGYEPFFRCAEGYAYGWWLKDLIEKATPLLKGFSLEW